MSSMFKKFARVPDVHNKVSRGHPKGFVLANVNDEGLMTIGFSFVSKKDTFNRKMAHVIANGRFDSQKYQADIFNPAEIEELINMLPPKATLLDDIVREAADFFSVRFDDNHLPRQIYTGDTSSSN